MRLGIKYLTRVVIPSTKSSTTRQRYDNKSPLQHFGQNYYFESKRRLKPNASAMRINDDNCISVSPFSMRLIYVRSRPIFSANSFCVIPSSLRRFLNISPKYQACALASKSARVAQVSRPPETGACGQYLQRQAAD